MRDEDVFQPPVAQVPRVDGRNQMTRPQVQGDGQARQLPEEVVGVRQQGPVGQQFAPGHEVEVDAAGRRGLAAVVVQHRPGLFEHLPDRRVAEARLPGGRQVAHAATLGAAGLRRQVDDEVVRAAADVAGLEATHIRWPIPVHRIVLSALVRGETGLGEQGELHADLRDDVRELFVPGGPISSVAHLPASRLPATLFGMNTLATSLDATRHRLLEGVLLRLARRPDAGEFVLRGGMLMRHWFRPLPRPAEDLDLVATFPFDVEEAARRFLPVLADDAVADGVAFDVERTRFEGIWLSTGSPGVRVFASGTVGEAEADFNVDITFGPPPRPAPVFGEIPTASGEPARVWVCRPEAVVGHKVQALWHRGMLGWRPKDLIDLRLLLACVPMDAAELRGAIAAYLADVGGTGDDARAIFGQEAWWSMKLSSARWLDFVKSSRGAGRAERPGGRRSRGRWPAGPGPGGYTMSGGLAGGFLDDIVAHIDDDTPRLVYADWLEENGHHDRAEFIRVQIERSRLPAWDAAQVRLRLREQELLKQHGEKWLAELPVIEGAKWEGFRRGIVAEVSFASFEAMRQSAHACRAVAPVEAVTVRWPRRKEAGQAGTPIAELRELSLTGRPSRENEIGWLADSPQLATLRSLTARGLWPDGLGRLIASPHLTGLKALRLPSSNLGNAGIRALIRAASLTALEELDLSGRGRAERYNDDPVVRSPGMEWLAGWAGLAAVRSLTLSSNEVGLPGLRALLRSQHVRALKELSLRDGRLDGQAMAELRDARPELRLETLDIGENVLKELGVAYLASAPCLSELKALWLDRCEVPSPAHASSRRWPSSTACGCWTSATTTSVRPGWRPCSSVSRRHCTRCGCATTTSSTTGWHCWPGRRGRMNCSRWT
jgi:uncharacterized protein (TIGR02996 family)